MILEIVIIFFISYLFGSIPSGIIFARLFSLGDLRKIGSGSIGTTNVMRTGNYNASILTLIVDFLKSYTAIQITLLINEQFFLFSACIVLIGHIFPIWLKFKGGKGFASYLGIIFSLNIFLFIMIIPIWIIVFFIKRISSLAALITSFAVVLFSIFVFHSNYFDFNRWVAASSKCTRN